MTSFTAEIKPQCVCMHVSCDFPGNINRGWNSSITVESINCLKTPFSFSSLSSSNSNHKQHLFLLPHSASPNSQQACSKVSWKTPKDVHISFGTAYERWKLRWVHAAAAITLMAAANFVWGGMRQVQSIRGDPPYKRKNLITKCNGEGAWSWCDVKTQPWILKSSRKRMQSISWIIIGNPEDLNQNF